MRNTTLHYSTTPSLRRSITAGPTKLMVYPPTRQKSRPCKRGALPGTRASEVGSTSRFAHTTIA